MKKVFTTQRIFLLGGIVLIAVAVAVAGYFYVQYQRTQQLLKNPTEATRLETTALIGKVEALMELPKGEQPTIATVSDKTKLKEQSFFAKAENGDKVLIYTQARKAILYRPATNKIIEVGPVTITSNKQPTVTPVPARVVIYNGTATVGYASTIEEQLKGKIAGIQVVEKSNPKGLYTKTLVVDFSGSHAEVAKALAKELNGEVGQLPTTETKPNADIAIYLGK